MKELDFALEEVFFEMDTNSFIFFPSGFVDGSRGYLHVWFLEGDLMIPRLVFRESSCLLYRKALCITRVSFACINNS